MHEVRLTESAFEGFQRLAQAIGLTVDEYLNQIGTSAASPDEFVMTPEIRAGIEEGLEQARRGETVSLEGSRTRLARFKAEWRQESPR